MSNSTGTSERNRSEPDSLDLSVVIVNYNVREFLENSLESVFRATTGISTEVLVVDNDSADGSTAMVRDRYPQCRLIENRENVGFSRANNQAIRVARGRHILLLNPDTVVQEDTLRVMMRFLDQHEDAGAVGCMILNPDGTFAYESRRSFPTPFVAISRVLGLSKLFPGSKLFGRYNLTFKPINEVTEVDALSGSCMMLRGHALRSTDDMLLFDEQFFMYGEDLDLCYRIQQLGWKLYYTPETQIIHYKGESTKKGDLRYVRLFYGAMLRFTEKHFSGQYSALFRTAIRLGILMRGSISAARRLLRSAAPAVVDFAIVVSAVAIVAGIRFGEVPRQILFTIAPAYAAVAVTALAIAGAYKRKNRHQLRFVVPGVLAGFIAVAALSFFVKQIAYSRLVVLASAPLAMLGMAAWRRVRREAREGPARTILVGTPAESDRVSMQLRSHPNPPLVVLGFVAPEESDDEAASTTTRLGVTRQLRDIVRLTAAESVVFSTGSNSRRDIFGWMQELRDLPVSLKMLDTRESYVIGKSSIDQLSLGEFVEADVALGISRSAWSHRAFDLLFAAGGLIVAPIVLLLASVTTSPRLRYAAGIARRLPGVLAGRHAVVGYDQNREYRPPESWGLRPGIVPVVPDDGDPRPCAEIDATYAYYAMNQSATADWAIVRRALRNPSVS